MKITRQKPEDAQTERYLIISLIVSENVCRGLYRQYNSDYFQSKMTKEISKWCFEFFTEYDDAIKKEIESLLEMKSKSGKLDPDLEEEIRKFLLDLSEEYSEWESLNEEFYLELGIKYFKKRSFIILSEQLKEAATSNDVDEAEKRYANFTKVSQVLSQAREITSVEGVDALKESMDRRPPSLFSMPGALGKLIGPIERETFIGILGGEKSGKTYHLMMFAMAAAKRGLKVAMLETGDLTQDQLDSRFYSYFTGKANKEKNAGNRIISVMDCLKNQTGECPDCTVDSPIIRMGQKGKYVFTVDVKDRDVLKNHSPCIQCYSDRERRDDFKGSVWWQEKKIGQWTWDEAKRTVTKFKKRFKGEILSEAFPMQSMKASDIRNWVINKQKYDGKLFDIIIVDYPDILLPEGNREFRHQENEKWMILRQISQEFHCCVIASTQANAKAYNRDKLTLDNYSEDKRKYSHVTHFYAINKNKFEPHYGCSRFSTLMLREDSIGITNEVTLLQNLNVCNPCTKSFFGYMPLITDEE